MNKGQYPKAFDVFSLGDATSAAADYCKTSGVSSTARSHGYVERVLRVSVSATLPMARALLLLLLAACTSPDATTDPEPPPGLVVLQGGTTVDRYGAFRNDVWIHGDAIWGLSTDAPPDDATIIDVTGKFITPGLVDAHVHLAHSGATVWTGDPLEQNLRASLYHGVLNAYDLGGPEVIFAVRDAIEAGSVLGPHLKATGPFLTAVGSHPCESSPNEDLCTFVAVEADPAEHIESAAAAAGARRAAGADAVKVALADASFTAWPTTRLDLGALADVTAGGVTIAHVDEDADLIDALAAGVSVLAHPVFAAPMSDAALGMVNGVPVHSTVGAFAAVVDVLDGVTDLTDDGLILGPGVIDNWIYLRANPNLLEEGWAEASADWAADARANLPALDSAGALLLPGSDAGYYFVPHGTGLHRELSAMVEAGWTPLEALTAATATSSEALGFQAIDFAPDRPADFLILNSDPTLDVAALDDIDSIMLSGAIYPREELRTVDLAPEPTPGFCFSGADCGDDEACDGLAHTCGPACPTPGAYANDCGEDAYCLADDALASPDGVCHPPPGLTTAGSCDLYAQNCAPSAYAQACVPFDGDTNGCWTSGPRGAGQTCAWDDAPFACEVGLYCSLLDFHCYTLCDPNAVDACADGLDCTVQQSAPGVPWFGLCL